MYRLGHQIKHHYWPYVLIGMSILCCLIVGLVVVPRLFHTSASIKQSEPVIHHLTASNISTQHITERMFSFNLPGSWHEVPPPAFAPQAQHSWQGTANDAARHVDIYVDQVPSSLAVNHLLPVQVVGANLQIAGSVSDNCVNFTDKATESTGSGTALAKWDSVNFICDMGNYERDVVTIGSIEGVNTVILNGSKSGKHHILIVYTDNNMSPDYSILTTIVQSFHML